MDHQITVVHSCDFVLLAVQHDRQGLTATWQGNAWLDLVPVEMAGQRVMPLDTESRQTHLNALEHATIDKTINTSETQG